jgi:hypothetical protein
MSGVDNEGSVTSAGGRRQADEASRDLTITPHPVLVDQIDRFFAWMPNDLCTAVNVVKDRTRVLFLEHLCYLFQKNNGDKEKAVFVVKRQMESNAHAF